MAFYPYPHHDYHEFPLAGQSYLPLSAHQYSAPAQETRHSTYRKSHSGANLTPFAQFLKEDDERFFATFPEAAEACAAQQQPQQPWVVLDDAYRDFAGAPAFNASHGTYSFSYPTSSVHAPNVLDVMQDNFTIPYVEHASSSHTSYPYSLDPNPCVGISPHDPYNQLSPSAALSQNVTQFAPEFPSASFYTRSMADSEIHPGLQHENVMPLPSPTVVHSAEHSHSPQLQQESPLMDFPRSPTEPIFSPVEIHHPQMYSLSPEAIVAGSPASPTLPPQALSPVAIPEQLTLPPVPPELHSDSESQNDPSGPSSPRAALAKPSVKRKRRRNLSEELETQSQSSSPRNYMYGKIPLQKPTPPSPPPAPKVPKPRPASASQSEKKSLALACFFCRGRKIACGPQDPNSADRTCNQCHRRSLKCEYPTESRRGMRKRKSAVVNPGFPTEQPKGSKLAVPGTSDSKA